MRYTINRTNVAIPVVITARVIGILFGSEVFMQKTIWNAALYLRLSKEDKERDESNSIENQKALLLDFASKDPSINVVKIFSDDGFTGANFDRVDFQKMISHIEQDLIDCVIVKDFSRLGRDHIGMGKYIQRYFADKGIRFISINNHYDSLTSDMSDINNSLIVPFQNIIDEAFLEDISTKTKSQLEIKRKNGEFVCNYTVYGYLKTSEKKLKVDDYAADIVKSIFDYKLNGYNEQQIASLLNAKGVLSPAEHKKSLGLDYSTPFAVKEKSLWTVNAIKRILTNKIYIGFLEQGKRTKASYRMTKFFYKPEKDWIVHENNHEPIISTAEFNLVQKLIKKDTRISAGNQKLHMFSGFVICGDCSQPMIMKTAKKKEKCYVYFICSTHKKYGTCKNNNISDKVIEKAVMLSIKQHIASLLSVDSITNDLGTDTLQSRQQLAIENMIKNNLGIIRENQNYLVKSQEQLIDGFISESEYVLFTSSFKNNIETAENSITGLKEQLRKLTDHVHQKTLIEKFREHENITELNRHIVANFIEAIVVHNDKSCEIQYCYIGEFEHPLNVSHSQSCKKAVM